MIRHGRSEPRSRWVPALVASLLLATVTGPAVLGQDDPPAFDTGRPIYPAYVHPGTCDDPVAEPAYDLSEATARLSDDLLDEADELRGAPGAIAVVTATQTLDVTFDDLFDPARPHALLIHQSAEEFGTVVACGDLGGFEDDGRIVIGLVPQNDSGVFGVAVFDEDETGFLGLGDNEVNVTVHLTTLAAPSAPEATAPEPADSAPTSFANAAWLVDAAWVEDRVIDPEDIAGPTDLPIVVGVWEFDETVEATVPGTIQLDWALFALSETTPDALAWWRGQIENQILSLGYRFDEDGLQPDMTIVLYDDGSLGATAVWWLLDYVGHEEKRLLDGGVAAWVAATGSDIAQPGVSTGPPAGDIDYPAAWNEDVLATMTEIQDVLADPNVVLVDTRLPEEFAAGHLPAAVNVPYTDLLAPGAGTYWADPAAIGEALAAAGVAPEARVILYGAGGEDVGPYAAYFVLGLLGYESVAVYPAGWVEWSSYPELPREPAG